MQAHRRLMSVRPRASFAPLSDAGQAEGNPRARTQRSADVGGAVRRAEHVHESGTCNRKRSGAGAPVQGGVAWPGEAVICSSCSAIAAEGAHRRDRRHPERDGVARGTAKRGSSPASAAPRAHSSSDHTSLDKPGARLPRGAPHRWCRRGRWAVDQRERARTTAWRWSRSPRSRSCAASSSAG